MQTSLLRTKLVSLSATYYPFRFLTNTSLHQLIDCTRCKFSLTIVQNSELHCNILLQPFRGSQTPIIQQKDHKNYLLYRMFLVPGVNPGVIRELTSLLLNVPPPSGPDLSLTCCRIIFVGWIGIFGFLIPFSSVVIALITF